MTAGLRLRVDAAACAGVGICLHVAPDLVRADSWGYPILLDRVVDGDGRGSEEAPEHERQATAAVRACPRRALLLG